MKILLIMPDAAIHRLRVGGLSISFREAPLTLTTLAALVPAELEADVRIVDESIEAVPEDASPDLVGISCLTGTAPRAYQMADRFRSQGVPVVLGGVHVSLMPEEARQHADALVIGFAEKTWPALLRDFAAGQLRGSYHDPPQTLRGVPIPRRDLQKRFGYMMPNTVFATRGCRGRCSFCTVSALKWPWQTRPVEEVIDEVRRLPSRRFAFNDVSLVEDKDYARELFTALIPLKKKWGGLATTRLAADEEMMQLMSRSGCVFILTGFESVNSDSLNTIRKGFNVASEYRDFMTKAHACGIIIQGCFIFGLDHDRGSVFADTVELVNELQIDIPRYAVYTPYPGTPAFAQLRSEGRILHQNWSFYDTQHVVFEPKHMSAERLTEGFHWSYAQSYSLGSVVRRTLRSRYFPATFAGNLAYRRYLRRLCPQTGNGDRP